MNNVVLEDWKDIKGYEGLYLISNYGRVMSLRRKKSTGKGYYYLESKILKQSKTTTGYWKIELNKNGVKKSFKVHRLVAQHYIANPYDKENINHKDGNPLNNYFENLEWVNQGENVTHSLEMGLRAFFNIDEKTLSYLYIEKNMSPNEIGNLLGVSRKPIDQLIDEYGIRKDVVTKYQIDEEWLAEQFRKGVKNKDLAKVIGCDQSLISVYKTRLEKGENIYVTKQ